MKASERDKQRLGGWVSGLSILPHKPKDLSLILRTHIKNTGVMCMFVISVLEETHGSLRLSYLAD